MRKISLILLAFFAFISISHAQVSWVMPSNAKPGDTLTVYYNPSATGANLTNPSSLVIHWGINEIPPQGSGNWEQPPQSMWPTGTVAFGDGKGVESPLSKDPDGTWSIKIATNDTTRSIHYVFHTGSPGTSSQAGQWTWSSSGNWNFYLVEPVNYGNKQVEFIFDPRSSGVSFSGTIDTVYLAGTFNGWANNNSGVVTNPAFAMTRMPDGTFRKIQTLPIGGPVEYKFVINGNNWYPDPDNPLVDASNNGNSVLNIDSTAPSFVNFTPASGTVVSSAPSGFRIVAQVLRGSNHGINYSSLSVKVDGVSVLASGDSGYVVVMVPPPAVGRHDVVFSIKDSSGAVDTAHYAFGIFDSTAGYVTVDPTGNDNGPGDYTYPAGYIHGSADIEELRITPTTADDSLLFVLKFADISVNTGASIILTSSAAASLVQDPVVSDLQELEWQSKGIYIAIAPGQDSGKFNAVYSSRSPFTRMMNISLNPDAMTSDSIYFKLSLADLQSVLGTFTGKWYISTFSYLVDNGGSVVKIDSAHGGSNYLGNPSVFDVLFVTPNTQARLLSNYTAPSSGTPVFAKLDNAGRGYQRIMASDMGLDFSTLPVLTILTQPVSTHHSTWTVAGTLQKADGTPDSSTTTVTFYMTQSGTPTVMSGVPVNAGSFSQLILLQPGDNVIQVKATNSLGKTAYSAALHLNYIVDKTPTAVINFKDNGSTILAFGDSSKSKVGGGLTFQWKVDTVLSASKLTLPSNPTTSQVSVLRPTVSGEYYFTLTVVDSANDTDVTRSYFTYYQNGDSISVPSYNSVPDFVKSGRIYEIFVKSFTPQGTISAATQQLSYIKNLGYNIIWLMPIMQNEYPIDAVGGGYDITNFCSVAPEYGTMADLRNFIKQAHALGLRVILDITPNHVSPAHPWVKSAAQYKQYSPYWNYLQHTFGNYSGEPDGLDEHLSADGTYIHFSNWSLVNLNWNDVDLRDAMLDVMRFWLNQGADGFRFDVYWGPHGRSGDANFDQPLRQAIKHRKMDAFILAEATGTGPSSQQYYADDGGGADAAYDRKLWQAMANGGNSNAPQFTSSFVDNMDMQVYNANYYPGPNSYFMRYLENHDESRITYDYSNINQTMPLAAVLMTVPGIPMIYAGQEVGFGAGMGQFAGRRFNVVFKTPYTSLLLPLYEKLGNIRGRFPAFWTQTTDRISNDVNNNPLGLLYAFERPYNNQNAVIFANFSASTSSATVDVTQHLWLTPSLNTAQLYWVNDLMNGTSVQMTGQQLTNFNISLSGYGSAIYTIGTTQDSISFPVITDVQESANMPKTYALMQNYPNPFNPTTTIQYAVPKRAFVRLDIYNALGQHVETLVNSEQDPGTHEVIFNGNDLASGVYFYKLSAGNFMKVNKMLMIK